MTGPYQNLPAHGVAFDTWAGIVTPQVNDEGFAYLPEHASMGIHAGPLFGALGILAAVLRARTTGEGSFLEIAQSDAAAAMDWYRSETWRAYERPESEVTGNKADDYERREPGTAGMIEGVRYQVYEAKDGRYVLFMASEQAFWKNFCEAVGRTDLFERWPGSKYADHARGNLELRAELRDIFRTRTAEEWIDFGVDQPTSRSPRSTPRRPSPRTRSSTTASTGSPTERLGAEQLATPLKFVGEELPAPTHAPTVGQHTDEVLRDLLGWDDDRIAESGPGRPWRPSGGTRPGPATDGVRLRPMPPAKTRVPAVEGWFTLDDDAPALLGSRCTLLRHLRLPQGDLLLPQPRVPRAGVRRGRR